MEREIFIRYSPSFNLKGEELEKTVEVFSRESGKELVANRDEDGVVTITEVKKEEPKT